MVKIKHDLTGLSLKPIINNFNHNQIIQYIEDMDCSFQHPKGNHLPNSPDVKMYFFCNNKRDKNITLDLINKNEDGRPPWSSVFVLLYNDRISVHIGEEDKNLKQTYHFIKWLLDHYQCKVLDSDYGRDFTEIVQKEGVNGLFEVTE